MIQRITRKAIESAIRVNSNPNPNPNTCRAIESARRAKLVLAQRRRPDVPTWLGLGRTLNLTVTITVTVTVTVTVTLTRSPEVPTPSRWTALGGGAPPARRRSRASTVLSW